MIIEQIYTACLSQASYYIECNGEAAVIDPVREASHYIERAKQSGAKIRYVFETHFHADFVSGHLELANQTGALIVYGPTAKPSFEAYIASDGEEFILSKIKIKLLHTPGHTMESSCYLLIDENGKESVVFTGDTLFIGDVGRPDLAVSSKVSKEDLAGLLFDSIHEKLFRLPDDIMIYPGHGAGSACGKKLSKEKSDTLQHQKQSNYALRPGLTRKEFIQEVIKGLLPPPGYFSENARMNKEGYMSLEDVKTLSKKWFDPKMFLAMAEVSGAVIIDTRSADEFSRGHIRGSVFIGIDGGFAPWLGTLFPDPKTKFLLVTTDGREDEVLVRMARIGYHHCIGFLEGGFEAWINAGLEIAQVPTINATQLVSIYNDPDINILDVRRPVEFEEGRLEKAKSFPLEYLPEQMTFLDQSQLYYVYCAGGYRSVIACSLLMKNGYYRVINIEGGYTKISEDVFPEESFARG